MVRIVVSDGAGHVVVVTPDASGNWSAPFNTLAFGSYSFTATAEDSSRRALEFCQRDSKEPCKLYAVDEKVVWQ